jgi:peptide/nickel transport system substrate-binding protein/oligopeptide transport system substrate-binding protein
MRAPGARLRLWLAAAVLAAAAASCGRQTGRERVLELALETSPNRLDPALAVDVAEGEICALVFDGLVGFAPDGALAPSVARSWEIEDGGRRYRFHLDPRATFSNGKRVRASDVAASFTRLLAPATASPRAWVLERVRGARAFRAGEAGSVAGLDARDDSTLVMEIEEPFAPFLAMLALPGARVVDTAEGEPGAAGVPVGSGPWTVREWVRGDRITLVPNPHHARAARGLDAIRYRVIPEPFTRIAEFESGTIDVLEIPDAEVSRFLTNPETAPRVQKRPELRVVYIGLNNRRLTDARVRQALNHAVNVDEITRVLASGAAVPAHGSIPPALAGYRERPGLNYDPARARRLLAESGHADGLSLEIWLRESAEGNRVVEAVQGYLQAVGVRATLVRREWTAFKEAVSAGQVDAFLLDWFADYPDAENFLYPLFHSGNQGGGGNRSFFADAEVDRLLVDASRMQDAGRRADTYARVDSLVYAHTPWIYLYFPSTFHIVSNRVSGYRLPALYLGNDFSGVTKSP